MGIANQTPPEVNFRSDRKELLRLINWLRKQVGTFSAASAFWVSEDDPSLTNQVNIGALPAPGGLLMVSIVGGYATPSIAVANTDFASPNAFYVVTRATNAPTNSTNLGAQTTGVLQQTVTAASATVLAHALTTGEVLFGGSDALIAQSSNFYFDTANVRLGVGTSSPDASTLATFRRSQNAATSLFVTNSSAGAAAAADIMLQAAASDSYATGPFLLLGTFGRNRTGGGTYPYFAAGSTYISAYTDDGVTFDMSNVTPGVEPTWRWVTHDPGPTFDQRLQMLLDYDGYLALPTTLGPGGIDHVVYAEATTGRLLQATLGGNMTLIAGVLDSVGGGGGGGVTAVSATLPLTSTGGTTPNIALNYDNVTITLSGAAGTPIQRAALTGAVTANAGSNTTAFGSFAALTVLANATAGAAVPAPLAASTNGDVLRMAGGVLGWGAIPVASVTGAAPSARLINTTAPITGGGDLSADRTIAITDFVASGASHARGAVPDPGAVAGSVKFLCENATWAVPAGAGTITAVTATAPLTSSGGTTPDIAFPMTAGYIVYGTGASVTGVARAAYNRVSLGLSSQAELQIYNDDTGASAIAGIRIGTAALLSTALSVNVVGTNWTSGGGLTANDALIEQSANADLFLSNLGNGTVTVATGGSRTARVTVQSGGQVDVSNLSGGSDALVYAVAASGRLTRVALGSGVSFSGGTLSATGSGGTVTNVTATAPVNSSGGTTPNITLSYDGVTLGLAAGTLERKALTGAITASDGSNSTFFGAMAALSVLANATNASAVPTAFAAGTSGDVLWRNGTALVWSHIPVASVTGAQPTITWPAATTVLYSTGTSTDPSGNASITIDNASSLLQLANPAKLASYNGALSDENVRFQWVSNQFFISSVSGSGTARDIVIDAGSADAFLQGFAATVKATDDNAFFIATDGASVPFIQAIHPDNGDAGINVYTTKTVASSAGARNDSFVVGSASSISITGGTNITTATGFNQTWHRAPVYADGGGGAKSVNHAATVYIDGAPTATGSVTIANPYSLWIDTGEFRLDGAAAVSGASTPTFGNTPGAPGQAVWIPIISNGVQYMVPGWFRT